MTRVSVRYTDHRFEGLSLSSAEQRQLTLQMIAEGTFSLADAFVNGLTVEIVSAVRATALSMSLPALEGRARRAAARIGLKAEKSTRRIHDEHHRGGFMLVKADDINHAIDGYDYDLTAEEVIERCAKREG